MKTQSARQHLQPHQNLRIFKMLRTHMTCNKDGKSLSLGKMQSPKQYCSARAKWLLAKVKGIYCNKVYCFAGLIKSVGKRNCVPTVPPLSKNKQNRHHSVTRQAAKVFNDKTLLRYSTMDKFSIMTAIFSKSKSNYQKQTTSCPDNRHLLLQNIKDQ